MKSTQQSFTRNFSSNQNLIEEQSALIELLEKKVENCDLQNFYQQTSLNFPERSSPSKKAYAQELLQQISQKSQILSHVKRSKYSDLVTDPSQCSLNFPQTPTRLRRQREKEMQKKMKDFLDVQISEKISNIRSEKSQKIENERKEFEVLMKKLQDENKEKVQKSKIEKDYLTQSWINQMKYKDLKSQLLSMETNGVIPRSKKTLQKKDNFSAVPLTIIPISEEPKAENVSLTPVLKKHKSKSDYKARAVVIKNQIDQKYKESYQYKIKKIIEHVKSNRKQASNSLSPTNISSYKRLV